MQAAALDVLFVNLVEQFAALPAREATELFLDGYHLSEAGHERTARSLLEWLRTDRRTGVHLAVN